MSNLSVGQYVLMMDNNRGFPAIYLIKEEVFLDPTVKDDNKWYLLEDVAILKQDIFPLSYIQEHGEIY